MDSILLADIAARFEIEIDDARDIIAATGAEVLPDADGDLHVIEGEATAALFAAGRFPPIVGCDPAAPPPVFSPSLEAFDDE